jgi:broad specificity phosphatase PhoE
MSRVRAATGDLVLFSSGHFLRMVATRWIGIEPINGKSLMLGKASLSAVGYENGISQPRSGFGATPTMCSRPTGKVTPEPTRVHLSLRTTR